MPSPTSAVPSTENGSGLHGGASTGREIRVLAAGALAATFVLIAVGALVRATGSGLGCTGWPKCTAGRWLPPVEYHALIEYAHRFVAFVDVVLVAMLAVVAFRRYRAHREILGPAVASVGLIIFQAVLGGIVVHGDLAAVLVSAHLGTAMLLVGSLVLVAVGVFAPRPRAAKRVSLDLGSLPWITAGVVFALILVGATVRAENAGLAFRDWPLFDGAVIPGLSALRPALHVAHRALALGAGVLVAVLAVRGWRLRREVPALGGMCALVGGLFLAQVLAGAAAVWSRLAPAAIVVHVTLSSLVWGSLVAVAAVSRLSPMADAEDVAEGRRGIPVAQGSVR